MKNTNFNQIYLSSQKIFSIVLRVFTFFILLLILTSCTPRHYKYLILDSRLNQKENFNYEFEIPENHCFVSIDLHAVNFHGNRAVGLELMISNDGLDTMEINLKNIKLLSDNKILQRRSLFIDQSIKPLSDLIKYVYVSPDDTMQITIGADHYQEKLVPHQIELQLTDVFVFNGKIYDNNLSFQFKLKE